MALSSYFCYVPHCNLVPSNFDDNELTSTPLRASIKSSDSSLISLVFFYAFTPSLASTSTSNTSVTKYTNEDFKKLQSLL